MRNGGSMKAGVMAVAVGVALLLAAAAVKAQPPEHGRRGGPEGGWQQGTRWGEGPGAQRGGWGEQQQRPRLAGGGLGLLAGPDVDVDVIQNDDGVTLLVTSDKPELAQRIRERLPEAIERMRKMHAARTGEADLGARKAHGDARHGRRRAGGRRGFNAFADEKVDVEFVTKDKGVAVILTSDDPEVAAKIKKAVPLQIRMMKQFGERGQGPRPGAPGGHQMGAMGEWLRLLASDKVEIKRRERHDGVTLTYTSDDDEVAERLKELSAQQLEHLEQMRECCAIQQRGPQQRGPQQGYSGGGRAGRGHDRWRARKGYGQPGTGGQREDELRKIIREEIRRTLRDMEEGDNEDY